MSISALGRETLAYGVGGVALRLLSLLLLPILTNFLSPTEYGVVALLTALMAIAQPIFSLGSGALMGLVYFEADSNQEKATVVWSTLVLHLAAAAVLLMSAYLVGPFIGSVTRVVDDYLNVVNLALVNCALANLSGDLMLWLQFERRLTRFLIASLGGAAAGGIVSVVSVTVFDLGVAGVIWGQVAANLFVFVVVTPELRNFGFGKLSLNVCWRLFKDGIPLLPAFVFLFILMQSNRYILEAIDGLASVGIYSIGFSLGSAVGLVVNAVSTAWFPFFMQYKEKPKEAEVVFGKVTTYYVIALGFCCLTMAIFADTIVSLVVQSQFTGAAQVVGIVALSQAFLGLFTLLLPGMYFRNEVHFTAFIQGVAALVSLPFNYFLIKEWGVTGAGFGVLASSILLVSATILWNQSRATIYPRIRYEWSKMARITLLFILVYITYLGLQKIELLPPFLLPIILIFSTLALLFGQIDSVERHSIRNWMGLT